LKKILALSVVVGLLLTGCSDDNDVDKTSGLTYEGVGTVRGYTSYVFKDQKGTVRIFWENSKSKVIRNFSSNTKYTIEADKDTSTQWGGRIVSVQEE